MTGPEGMSKEQHVKCSVCFTPFEYLKDIVVLRCACRSEFPCAGIYHHGCIEHYADHCNRRGSKLKCCVCQQTYDVRGKKPFVSIVKALQLFAKEADLWAEIDSDSALNHSMVKTWIDRIRGSQAPAVAGCALQQELEQQNARLVQATNEVADAKRRISEFRMVLEHEQNKRRRVETLLEEERQRRLESEKVHKEEGKLKKERMVQMQVLYARNELVERENKLLKLEVERIKNLPIVLLKKRGVSA